MKINRIWRTKPILNVVYKIPMKSLRKRARNPKVFFAAPKKKLSQF